MSKPTTEEKLWMLDMMMEWSILFSENHKKLSKKKYDLSSFSFNVRRIADDIRSLILEHDKLKKAVRELAKSAGDVVQDYYNNEPREERLLTIDKAMEILKKIRDLGEKEGNNA